MKATCWHLRQSCRICISPGLQWQELFPLASRDNWGIISFFIMGTLFEWHLQSYPSVSCLFSPKPHFVYKWWLYVKTFCLSSNQCLGSCFSTRHMTLTSQAYTQHKLLNCLVHCNMNWVFVLQSKLKPLFFSLSSVYVQMKRILSCNFWFEYCATWRCKASCI